MTLKQGNELTEVLVYKDDTMQLRIWKLRIHYY